MFVVDTNILIYAAETSFPEHTQCRARLQTWRDQPTAWYLTWNVLYEFVRVTTHPRVFSKPWPVSDAWSFVEALLASPSVGLLVATDRHSSVARQVWSEVPNVRGNLVHDAHTAVLMREHGIRRIYTRDTDFHRFAFLDVVDPTT
ncbi:MAG: TA system VapC family ribonuclease toxin [Myxococcota bacterium]